MEKLFYEGTVSRCLLSWIWLIIRLLSILILLSAVQTSQNKPPIVLNSTVANPQPYQLVVDPRIGLIVGSVASQASPKPSKIQVRQNQHQKYNVKINWYIERVFFFKATTNLQAPVVTPGSQTIANRNRLTRTTKKASVVSTAITTPPPLTPVPGRSVLIAKSTSKRSASQSPVPTPPATRSRGNVSRIIVVLNRLIFLFASRFSAILHANPTILDLWNYGKCFK